MNKVGWRTTGNRLAWLIGWSACAGLACLAIGSCQRTPQEQAIAAIESRGGKVRLTGLAPDRVVSEVDLSRTQTTDADLVPLRCFESLQALNLSSTPITDDGLVVVKDLTSLKKLNLTLTKVSDEGLKNLAALTHLEELYLIETGLTDASVDQLEQLSHLRMLVLLRTRLNTASIVRLRRALPAANIQIEPVRSHVR